MAVSILLGAFLDFMLIVSCLPLSFAIGLITLEYSIFKRYGWEDAETGYYNKNFLKVLSKGITDHHMEGGTVIRFITEGDSTAFSQILHFMEPGNSETVYMGEGTFLVISETQTDALVSWYEKLVLKKAKQKGLHVRAEHFTRTDEMPAAFFEECMKR